MKIGAVVGLLTLCAACAHPPKLDVKLNAERKAPGAFSFHLIVTNVESSVTVPILIRLTADPESAAGKPVPILQPTAFVLNRNESRTLDVMYLTTASRVRVTLLIKEAESGHLLLREQHEFPPPR